MSELQWLDKIMEIIHEGIAVIQNETIIRVSPYFAEILGYEEQELLGMAFEDLVESQYKIKNLKFLLAFLQGDHTERFEARLLSKDERIIHVEITPTIIEHQGANAILAAIKDLTSEVTLRTAVEQLEDRFAVLYDLSPIAYFTLDREGVIVQANAAAEKLLDCSAKEMLGVPLSEFVVAEEPFDPLGDILREVNWGKRVSGIEIQLKRSDDKSLWVSVSAQSLNTAESGQSVEIGFMAVDVTRRRAAEERLRQERERANLYLDVMTRDLNEIYHSTLFAIEDLRNSQDLSDDAFQTLDKMSWDIRRASRLIANVGVLMSLSQPWSGVQRTKLLPHVKKAIREVDRDFEHRSLKAKVKIPKKIEVMGHAFLWNIFFNVFYSTMLSDPKVEVEVSVCAEYVNSNNEVKIVIEDNTQGIPDDEKEKVFRWFEYPDAEQAYGNFNLTLVETYVSKMDGRIWIENRIPDDHTKGNKFVIVLPAWKEEIEMAPIVFYKSDHCVFCGPMFEALTGILSELGVNPSGIEVINVSDPESRVKESDLPAIPVIKIGSEELVGYIPEDELRSSITRLLMFGM